jgi:ectoine hydroxylase-related dioxygenase (phytanoyl-CoA dioxygenase family)
MNDEVVVDEGDIAAFAADGAVALRGLFADWVEPLRRGVARNAAEPGPYRREYTEPGRPGHFFGDYCNWPRIEEFRAFAFESPAAAVAARLMASRNVRLFHEHVLVKEPGTEERTPWHQDQPYYCVDGAQVCSFWMPLDPVPRHTCPEFVAGSHRWGKWFLPKKFKGADFERPDEGLQPVPDIDAERARYRILAWELAPGDAVAFHFLTLHGAPANPSLERRRRAIAWRWLGDDAVYARRSGETSPPFPGLDQRLAPGDPLDDPEFPLVWPRAA